MVDASRVALVSNTVYMAIVGVASAIDPTVLAVLTGAKSVPGPNALSALIFLSISALSFALLAFPRLCSPKFRFFAMRVLFVYHSIAAFKYKRASSYVAVAAHGALAVAFALYNVQKASETTVALAAQQAVQPTGRPHRPGQQRS
eukprot:m51a1_g11183 hypothetical protein (145) ;mRNA; f:4943-5516